MENSRIHLWCEHEQKHRRVTRFVMRSESYWRDWQWTQPFLNVMMVMNITTRKLIAQASVCGRSSLPPHCDTPAPWQAISWSPILCPWADLSVHSIPQCMHRSHDKNRATHLFCSVYSVFSGEICPVTGCRNDVALRLWLHDRGRGSKGGRRQKKKIIRCYLITCFYASVWLPVGVTT